jgi:hypothetical protein
MDGSVRSRIHIVDCLFFKYLGQSNSHRQSVPDRQDKNNMPPFYQSSNRYTIAALTISGFA